MNYLCLDIGNVLGKVYFDKFTKILSSIVNRPQSEVNLRINRYQGMHDCGLVSMDQILNMEFDIQSKTLRQSIIKSWLSIFNLDINILNAGIKPIEAMSFDGLKIALLSNVGYEHSQHLRESIKNYPVLNGAIHYFSCEVGVRKPNSLFYQSFLDRYPTFKRSVYVDDMQSNLDASKSYGFVPVRLDLMTMDKLEISARFDAIKQLVLRNYISTYYSIRCRV